MSIIRKIHLVECPRDAMQGWKYLIPTKKKVEYINALLQVGFDTIDMGSFVSSKAVPQMADTSEVIRHLDIQYTDTKLLVIVANVRGAEEAGRCKEIALLGFPFSVSETFQQRNTNSSVEESLERLEEIRNICTKNEKQLIVYISMGFGNPYGDLYSEEIVFKWASKIAAMGIKIISLADTVGIASPEQVNKMTKYLINLLPDTEIGVHLHSSPFNWKAKVEAALHAGCRRFDGALKGIGGCPMAGDILVGNMNTEQMIHYFDTIHLLKPLNYDALKHSLYLAEQIFTS